MIQKWKSHDKKTKNRSREKQVSRSRKNATKKDFIFAFLDHFVFVFCDCLQLISFCQVFISFPSFFGRKCCKTQEIMKKSKKMIRNKKKEKEIIKKWKRNDWKNEKAKPRRARWAKIQEMQKKPWVFSFFNIMFLRIFLYQHLLKFCLRCSVITRMPSDFAKCSWHFPHFFGRKSCKTQDVHDRLPQPRFPCGRPSRGATRSCRQHLPKSCLDTPVKTTKTQDLSFHFFFSISFHLTSVLFIAFYSLIHSFLPSFLPSFFHTCHGCACQASLSAGVRSSVNAVPQRHFGPPDVLMFFYFIFLCFKKKCTFVFLT